MELSQTRAPEYIDSPHGERGNFRKLTFTLSQDAYGKLIQESARRKIAGEPNHLLSSLLREAVDLYMGTLGNAAE